MNLKLGEIEVNDFLLKSDTTKYELIKNLKIQSYDSDDDPIALFTIEQANVDRYTFDIDIYFIDNRLYKIKLEPVNLEMKNTGYPDEKYQNKKKKITDSFLYANLGAPLKETKAVLYYEFDWGSISSVAFFSGRNEFTGGFVEIKYKK